MALDGALAERLERMLLRFGGGLAGSRVLEPGCGAGELTRRLVRWMGGGGRIVAFDSSPGMMRRFRESVGAVRGVFPLCVAEERAWFPAGSFDWVVCFRFYPHLQDADGFLARCRRWLRADGRLVVANLEGSRELNAWHARHAGVADDVMPSGPALARKLRRLGWNVLEALDAPEEFWVAAENKVSVR